MVPLDGNTYTLAATGLPKIASMRIPQELGRRRSMLVRLYATRPTDEVSDRGNEGTDFKTFEADCADTEAWTGTAYLKVFQKMDTRVMDGRRHSSGGERPERVIHEKIQEGVEAEEADAVDL
ncbi:hypothetical protein [Streptomyces sp. KS 21]|uniref:hypothetical protein n=1 Tax=Streptomyces sp. KS 21 TaxID=2485150 RepID=UPI001063E38A|nr:hypothetical protein [Streptomyces sp. KS 21]TDU73519.1 hypothetical protein EDD91_0068 [Streptomyces sp. KS 21]